MGPRNCFSPPVSGPPVREFGNQRRNTPARFVREPPRPGHEYIDDLQRAADFSLNVPRPRGTRLVSSQAGVNAAAPSRAAVRKCDPERVVGHPAGAPVTAFTYLRGKVVMTRLRTTSSMPSSGAHQVVRVGGQYGNWHAVPRAAPITGRRSPPMSHPLARPPPLPTAAGGSSRLVATLRATIHGRSVKYGPTFRTVQR